MDYKLEEIIDIGQFQELQDRLNEIYSFPSAIIDNDGKVLTATAWQDVCTKFHRKNLECEKECIKSDQYIQSHLHEANPAVSYKCPHGLIDNATPIIIAGKHLGNFFTGQFFLVPPDLEFFRNQAKKYGFDEEAYLEAVRRVPIWNQQQLDSYLFFIKGLIEVITNIGLKNLREIEARKESQKQEERFRTILQTTTNGFWLVDTEGRILMVNDAYCRMSGYSENELLGMYIEDLEAIETKNDVAAHMSELVTKGYDRFETKHRRKDGQMMDVEVSVQVQPGEEKTIVVFLQDITKRRRAEVELREKEHLLSMTQQIAHIGSWTVPLDKMQGELNEEARNIFGITPANVALTVENFLGLIHEEDRDAMGKWIQSCVAGQHPTELEFRIIRPDGQVRYLCGRGDIFPSIDGTSSRLIGSAQDITERKQTEEKLLQAQKIESVGRLAGGVAHDFNNMLGIIFGHLDMIGETMTPDHPFFANLKEIRKAAEHSANLTGQLLAFARKQIIAPKILALNETVEGMLKMLRQLIGEDIHLVWLPAEGLFPVRMDPAQIDQVLMNVCVNARDAIAGVGKITIETANVTFDDEYCAVHTGFVPGEYALLAVSDDGCGMDRESLAKLFEPFFTTKESGKGTGLGLSMVYGIVKQNNGFINVYSEPGEGTTFKIYLPRQVGKAEQIQKSLPARPAIGGHETILLVEDEPELMEITKLLLQNQGYTVLGASRPSEAVSLARKYAGEIDLLMTDVVMPEMNGRDLARNLLSLYPNLKRLFMSGYTANVIAHHGVLEEGVHFIQKPFSRRDLADKIREVLAR